MLIVMIKTINHMNNTGKGLQLEDTDVAVESYTDYYFLTNYNPPRTDRSDPIITQK